MEHLLGTTIAGLRFEALKTAVICSNLKCGSCRNAIRLPLGKSISDISPDRQHKRKYNALYICGSPECVDFTPYPTTEE